MKKVCSLLLIVSFLISIFTPHTNAKNLSNARWINTSLVHIVHQYNEGTSECYVVISGYEGSTITNINISFDKVMGSGLVNIATWNDLSAGQRFRWTEYVPDVETQCLYRLSLTADVIIGEVVEHLDLYEDEFYTE